MYIILYLECGCYCQSTRQQSRDTADFGNSIGSIMAVSWISFLYNLGVSVCTTSLRSMMEVFKTILNTVKCDNTGPGFGLLEIPLSAGTMILASAAAAPAASAFIMVLYCLRRYLFQEPSARTSIISHNLCPIKKFTDKINI